MNIEGFEEELRAFCDAELRFDDISKSVYSVDASICEVEPIGIVLPHSKEGVLSAIAIASRRNIPIIARGAATGIAGGCIGRGLIIDCSKHLNQIIAIDYDAKTATCAPGVVQDRLNEALADQGYRLGPDTSTGNRATLGGMLSNNASGARSLRYGKMSEHIEEVELALYSGEVIKLHPLKGIDLKNKMALQNSEGVIYREVNDIREKYGGIIANQFPDIPRRASGYNLDELIKEGPLNLSKIIAGSEGTLGVVLELKVKIVPKPQLTGLCLLHFDTLYSAVADLNTVLQFNPLAVEMIDDKIISIGSALPAMRNKLNWLAGNPAAVVIVEFDGNSPTELEEKVSAFKVAMTESVIGYCQTILLDAPSIKDVWDLRKAGLGLLLSKRSYSRAVAFIEDIAVAPEQLKDFIGEFLAYLRSINKDAGIYGHLGAGCIHIRPYIDLRDPTDRAMISVIMRDVMAILLKHKGVLSGEHGDGYIRSWLNRELFGEDLYAAFCQLKRAFDPLSLMNPGKVVDAEPLEKNLRTTPAVKVETFLNFAPEGGFELAVDMCNGNAFCRKSEKVMCPSFQATGDEFDTTRARAQALRAIVNGKAPQGDLADKGIYNILDLCLECKGCKSECPSNVDMAKMKAEVLYQYQEKYGYHWRNRLFGNIDTLYRLLSPVASLSNRLLKSSLSKTLLNQLGISTERALPSLAEERFSRLFKELPNSSKNREVVLFNDTYNEFIEPGIGLAAVDIINNLGYRIISPPYRCCGRPLISKGILKGARERASHLVKSLFPYAERGIAIVGLEPSCLLTIIDDYPSLFAHDNTLESNAAIVARNCLTFDQFLMGELRDNSLPLQLSTLHPQTVLIHTHCHQKALQGSPMALKVIKALPGHGDVKEIDSGCCGMAGSFGYESEHLALSMKIGGLKLFPAIAAAADDVQIIADGFSCRRQIAAGTGRTALHLAEAIARRLKSRLPSS